MNEDIFVGIDFGTTNSCIAWFDPKSGRAEALFNAEGEIKTPSVVYVGSEEILVGRLAEDRVLDVASHPRIIRAVKRELASTRVWRVDGQEWTGTQIASEIIKKLKRDVEETYFRCTLERVVLTYPATFDEFEKKQLEEAAKLAGFREVELLEEPVAAAIAYLKEGHEIGNTVFVYDLGGGTFDIALVVRTDEEKPFRLAVPPSGLRIGGEDFDRILYEEVDRQIREKLGCMDPTDTLDLNLLARCRKYKENLSITDKPPPLSWLPGPAREPVCVQVGRAQFETLIRPYVDQTVEAAKQLAEAARGRIDAVILIGGSSRIPLIQSRLQEELGIRSLPWNKADIAVALGAAYWAVQLWAKGNSPDQVPTVGGTGRLIRPDWPWIISRVIEAGPEAAPGASPDSSFLVDPGGRDGLTSLEEAISQASDGAVIRVARGIHRLSRPLEITKSVTLLGERADVTRVVCDQEGYVLKVSKVNFVARAIAFEHYGPKWANVMVVDSPSVEVKGCYFRGGVRDVKNQQGGSGLFIQGITLGTVKGCLFVQNALHGIELGDIADVVLEDNTCEGNRGCGIVFRDKACGAARRNVCRSNGLEGIAVQDQAAAMMEENTCEVNQSCGICFAGNACGIARENVCRNNRDGIGVHGEAAPTLELNTCEGNSNEGIRYDETAHGIVRNNACRTNGFVGIGVHGAAVPTLVGNTCEGNRYYGIAYFDQAAGIAQNNVCDFNGEKSISIDSSANPFLVANQHADNQGQAAATDPNVTPTREEVAVDRTTRSTGKATRRKRA